MSRSVASPEADTPSYLPVRISVTISSEVLPILTLVWQPVAFSNGVTQSTFGSVEPSSAYPAQAMMFSCPSPWPTVFCSGSFGAVSPLPLVLPAPPLSLLPHAATPNAAIQATSAAHRPFVLMLPPDLGDRPRSRTSAPDATRRAPSDRGPRARPRTSSRGSGGRPEALHRRRAPRRSG